MSGYSFGNIVPDNKEELYKTIGSKFIFEYYFGSFIEGQKYKSPLRAEEKDASFQIDWNDHWNEYSYRDFGESVKPFDAITFVMRIKNDGKNYFDTIAMIFNELKDLDDTSLDPKPIVETKKREPLRFVKYSKTLTPKEYQYWEQYGINKDMLLKFKVYSLIEFRVNNKILRKRDPGIEQFVYLFGNTIWKLYIPYEKDKTKKFYGHNITGHIQGLDLLPEDDEFLFITKGYKDVMVFNKLGYPAIAPHSESTFLTPWELDHLKTRFKNIFVVYDNDSTGIKRCTEFSTLYNLYYWNVPHEYDTIDKDTKDPSDMVKNYSYKTLRDELYSKFEKYNI